MGKVGSPFWRVVWFYAPLPALAVAGLAVVRPDVSMPRNGLTLAVLREHRDAQARLQRGRLGREGPVDHQAASFARSLPAVQSATRSDIASSPRGCAVYPDSMMRSASAMVRGDRAISSIL